MLAAVLAAALVRPAQGATMMQHILQAAKTVAQSFVRATGATLRLVYVR
jgi:hypothetical protein